MAIKSHGTRDQNFASSSCVRQLSRSSRLVRCRARSSSCWRCRRRASASSATTTTSTQRIVDERLKQPLFANTAKIYAAPREVRPGQKLTVQTDRQGAARRQATPSTGSHIPRRWAHSVKAGKASRSVPGPQSYHSPGRRHDSTLEQWQGRNQLHDDHGSRSQAMSSSPC